MVLVVETQPPAEFRSVLQATFVPMKQLGATVRSAGPGLGPSAAEGRIAERPALAEPSPEASWAFGPLDSLDSLGEIADNLVGIPSFAWGLASALEPAQERERVTPPQALPVFRVFREPLLLFPPF